MKSFQYATALSPASARSLAGDSGAYLAGGNDLLALMKESLLQPATVVNIKSIPGLNQVKTSPSSWSIGSLVTVAELEDHPALKQTFPALQQAAAEVGSRQIRNVATVGGNLSQHSRCWYFRQRDVLCLKKGGDMCYARHGENKYHSLFTGNTCISPVVSNLAIALAALNASVIVQRGPKEITLSIPEFYARAWDNPTSHNSLEPGDLVLRIEIPVTAARSAYLQASEKAAFDWALVSCAAAGIVQDGKLSQARIFLGAVAPVPYQAAAATDFLEGKSLDADTAAQAAKLLLARAHPFSDNAYKQTIALALVQRALLQLKA